MAKDRLILNTQDLIEAADNQDIPLFLHEQIPDTRESALASINPL